MGSEDERKVLAIDGAALSVVIGASAVAGASFLVLALVQLGPLSGHMALHIALMNLVAPFAAIGIARRLAPDPARIAGKGLWLATLVQMGLLWASHGPAMHQAAHASATAYAALHAVLFVSASAFWISVVVTPLRWHAMLALLVSGKLACLLGAMLIFSPRVLLGASLAHGNHTMPLGPSSLDDQHLAGLLMIAACPLSYVLTAIVLAAHAVTDLERMRAPAFSGGTRRALMR